MKKIFLVSVLVIGFLGCKEVKLEDGRVPKQYLSKTKKLMGTYKGQFNGREATISIELRGGDTPTVQYQDARGKDMLAPNCQSEIGLLQSVYVVGKKSNPQIERATFAFDPANCFIDGNALYLKFEEKKSVIRFVASIVKRRRQHEVCEYVPGGPGIPPRRQCHYEIIEDSITGVFKKQ